MHVQNLCIHALPVCVRSSRIPSMIFLVMRLLAVPAFKTCVGMPSFFARDCINPALSDCIPTSVSSNPRRK